MGGGKEGIDETTFVSHDYEISGDFSVTLIMSSGGNNTAVFKQLVVVTQKEIERVGRHRRPVAILHILEL